MPGQVTPGGTHRWPANVNVSGTPEEASELTLTVKDPLGTVVDPPFPLTDLGDFVHTGTGQYYYDWIVPITAALGSYTAIWGGALGGNPLTGSDSVEVVAVAPDTSATAVGTYATLVGCKKRLGFDTVDAARDSLLQDLVNQANGDLESFMGRSACPIPQFVSTLASSAAIGDTTVTLASVAGLRPGEPIMFGPISGTHEHGFVLGVSGSVVTLQGALANAYGSGAAVERVILFNRLNALRGRNLYGDQGSGFFKRLVGLSVPFGVTSLESLEMLSMTDGSYETVPPEDWLLRPEISDRSPGWPADEIALRYVAGLTSTSSLYFPGRDIARARGAFGWAQIPDELHGIGDSLVMARWQMRSSGGAYQTGIGTDGRVGISQALDAFTYNRLMSYRVGPKMRVVGG